MPGGNPLSESEAYALALGLLARREHSARELTAKLGAKGVTTGVAETVIARLIEERLQSDERYAEVYLRQRYDKGYGPQRIRAELRERGVDDALVAVCFRRAEEEGEIDWYERAAEAYRKKYGDTPAEALKERAKRMRFLQYRGFSQEHIAAAMSSD